MLCGSVVNTLPFSITYEKRDITKHIFLDLGSGHSARQKLYALWHHISSIQDPTLGTLTVESTLQEPFIGMSLFHHEEACSTLCDLSQVMLHETKTYTVLLPLESTFVPWGMNSFPPWGSKTYTAHPLSYDLSPGPHSLYNSNRCFTMATHLYSTPCTLDWVLHGNQAIFIASLDTHNPMNQSP